MILQLFHWTKEVYQENGTIFLDFLLDVNQGEFKFDIICLQEVWTIPKYFKTNIPGYKPVVHKLHNQMDNLCSNVGGGVACWVKNEHDFEVLENISKLWYH